MAALLRSSIRGLGRSACPYPQSGGWSTVPAVLGSVRRGSAVAAAEDVAEAGLLEREAWSALSAARGAFRVDEVNNEISSRKHWVFLGCPGVGKGTYASRLAKLLGIAHISMGDLVRAEVKRDTALSVRLEDIMRKGHLVHDEIIFELFSRRLEHSMEVGEGGFILDGFPRTTKQAAVLDEMAHLDLVLNLRLREDVLISKCVGRRICSDCGGNFNLANIYIPAKNGVPEIVMPPLSPPGECLSKMTRRADDNEEVVRNRLEVYARESKPVEDYYRSCNRLLDFEITGGIPETWPRLLAALNVEDRVAEEVVQKVA